MKKMRLHIYIFLGICLVGFILGSFIDLEMMKAIFSRDNTFGLFMSATGTIPGYGCFAILGGMLFALFLERKTSKLIKAITLVFGIIIFGLSIFFSGREFFSENGFRNDSLLFLGFIIVLPIMMAFGYLGYRLAHNSNNKLLLVFIIVMLVAIGLSLVAGVTAIKSIFHRPRYRTVSLLEELQPGLLSFHPWWVRCPNYKDIITDANTNLGLSLTSEEFKSFPSGHAGTCAVVVLFSLILPLVKPEYEKAQLYVFYGGVAWTFFIAFTRILVGAHFLSDVSMGALLTGIFALVFNEVSIAINNKYQNQEPQVVEE